MEFCIETDPGCKVQFPTHIHGCFFPPTLYPILLYSYHLLDQLFVLNSHQITNWV